MTDERGFRMVLPEKINGARRTGRNIYVPTTEKIKEALSGMIPKADELPKYVPQGNELQVIEVARKNGKAVLLSGPTGVGKTLLATSYAAENNLPLLLFPASEDTTDWSMRGSFGFIMAPLRNEETGDLHDAKFQMFSPAQIALAAMSDIPVVLFIDELHKMRPGAAAILHALSNPTERTLYCYDLSGENYVLHRDTVVLAAVNPSYGEGGIDRLDAALRRRFSTVHLEMPDKETIMKIVHTNVGIVDAKIGNLIEKLAEVQAGIAMARDGAEGRTSSTMLQDANLDTETLSSIIEVPSPASIVETIKDVLEGLPVMDAIRANMINTIVTDFGHAKKALEAYVESKIPAGLRN